MTRPHPLRDSLLALSLLTVVPTGADWPEGERTDVAGWFPMVGVVIGAAILLVFGLAPIDSWAKDMPLLSSTALVAGAALFSRFLHHDGLADVADAWWGGATRTRRLEIMKDSATGAFGATALILAIAIQITAASELIGAGQMYALCVVPVFGRLSATFAAWLGKPARNGGLGSSVMGRPSLWAMIPAILAFSGTLAVVVFTYAGGGVGYAVCGLALALIVPHLIAHRMGGVTGDVMGASVVLVETLMYLAAAVLFVR